jgi:hypothetical protein
MAKDISAGYFRHYRRSRVDGDRNIAGPKLGRFGIDPGP